ncbi:MAG: sigma 54-interacting transcriptional regulator, partial [Deltaproteobacteria bacterium]|nr:sigma 54-interacting transcriptional regulator [Deltaproteobacteria bacterium]
EPFVALNCAALPPSLLESELFGYEAGAFTGAARRRIGRFEAADNGILFLDEIGRIPLEVQTKILRVVEYQTFERVGSSAPTRVNVRILGATNADLPALAADGAFQMDLLDRLSFEVLHVPPLRTRIGDVRLLTDYFAARMAMELGWLETPMFSDEAVAALEAYPWPGNVRELKNVVERAVYRSSKELITRIVFDPFPAAKRDEKPLKSTSSTGRPNHQPLNDPADLTKPLPEQVIDLEIRLIKTALLETQYNQRQAADRLGLSYHQFRRLYRKHRHSPDLT